LAPERVEYLPVRTYWARGRGGIVVSLKEMAKWNVSALAGNGTVITLCPARLALQIRQSLIHMFSARFSKPVRNIFIISVF
jgi:hypothetical protein